MDIMNFLAYGLDELKWKATTARAYKSAILQLFTPAGRSTITEDDLFQSFMKQMGSNSFKQTRASEKIIKPVMIKSHPIEALCPVKAFVEYRRRTAAKDQSARMVHPKAESVFYTPLIRNVRSSDKGLGSERISKYIDMVMSCMPRAEGQPKLKARAVGATRALLKGIPMDDVTTQGNWSSPVIVEAFYRLSRAVSNDFTTSIFS
ncbi:hypothetical protein BGZ81_000435 [Podila clonocystis]|nr:hypothetical protein BGZ81_000435 [Podila clonocystis]